MRDSEGARFGLLLLSKASKMPVCDEVSALIVVFRSDHTRTPIYLNAKQRARFFRINFRFYQVTFPYGAKTEENSTKRSRKTVDRSSGKVMCETCTCFLCWTATIHRKSYLKEAKSYLINIRMGSGWCIIAPSKTHQYSVVDRYR